MKQWRMAWLLCAVALVALVAFVPTMPVLAAEEAGSAAASEKPDHLVPYVPTPMEVVEEMLKMADVRSTDIVYDLGCGDGRIVVMAAKKFGARAYGVDIDPVRVKESRDLAQKEGVEKKVTVYEGDVFKTDVSSATVVTMYLLPDYNAKLRRPLEKMLAVGSRVVSHDFDMPVWTAVETKQVTDQGGGTHTVFLWKITPEMKQKPARAEGAKAKAGEGKKGQGKKGRKKAEEKK